MAINDLWEVSIRGVALGQPMFNVFHFLTATEAGGAPTPAAIMAGFQTKIQSSLLSCCSNLYSIVEYTCQKRYAAGAPFGASRGRLFVLSVGIAGSGTATTIPPQAAAYIGLYAEATPTGYLRGGKFIGGLAPGVSSNGQLTTAGQGVMATLAGKMTENLALMTGSATILNPVIYSRKRHSLNVLPYVLPVTGYSVAIGIKTLRRRTLGTPVGGY